MILLGLGNRARVGKDTVGKYLVDNHGFYRVAFGDAIRDVCSVLSGLDANDPAFKDSVAICGWSGGQLLQNVGTALTRMYSDILIDASRLEAVCSIYKRVVVTDVRRMNEAEAIIKLGGKLLKIDRPYTPYDEHPSENGILPHLWSGTIYNDGSLEDLYKKVDLYLDALT